MGLNSKHKVQFPCFTVSVDDWFFKNHNRFHLVEITHTNDWATSGPTVDFGRRVGAEVPGYTLIQFPNINSFILKNNYVYVLASW